MLDSELGMYAPPRIQSVTEVRFDCVWCDVSELQVAEPELVPNSVEGFGATV